MTLNSNIDYVTSTFEYMVLSKISGQPTYKPICKIKNEIKTNAASIPYGLRGGGHINCKADNLKKPLL